MTEIQYKQAYSHYFSEKAARHQCNFHQWRAALLFSDFTLNLYHLFREARITSITNATISPSPPPSNTLAP